jgi:hypothetical protein
MMKDNSDTKDGETEPNPYSEVRKMKQEMPKIE